MNVTKLVIIGGSAAGAKAAAKARRLDQNAEITILQKDKDLSMASCGYPYYVGGVFDDRDKLLSTPTGVIRDSDFFLKAKNIKALVEHEVTSINRKEKTVQVTDLQSQAKLTVDYDKLAICTGGTPTIPPIQGTDLEGVTTLVSMEDTDFLRRIRDSKKAKKAVIIGAGLIGLETCEALQISGLEVTVIEMAPQILPFLDPQLAKLTQNHIQSKGVTVLTDTTAAEFIGDSGCLQGVLLAGGEVLPCDVAVIATGVRPNAALAKNAGLEIGNMGGIVVDENMCTSDPDIYAAGDCVEIRNIITGKPTLAPMGDLANLQGRVVGENMACGNCPTFPGTIQTGICKVFDFTAGSTGLTEQAANREGIAHYETVVNASPDKPGFMGANLLISKLLIDKETTQILGYQCVGPGDVSRQLATASTAIAGKLKLRDIACLDLPYAPPFSLAIDHFIASAHIMENKLKGRFKTVTAEDVYKMVRDNLDIHYIDGRSPQEYEAMRLGITETLIPVGALKNREQDLPEDKGALIICFCKISLRGYESALILENMGYTNVRVMEGGIMAWPYGREK